MKVCIRLFFSGHLQNCCWLSERGKPAKILQRQQNWIIPTTFCWSTYHCRSMRHFGWSSTLSAMLHFFVSDVRFFFLYKNIILSYIIHIIPLNYKYLTSFFAGQECTFSNGRAGVCKKINKCKAALNDLYKRGSSPRICDFDGDVPVVCCLQDNKPPKEETQEHRVDIKEPTHDPKRTFGKLAYESECVLRICHLVNPMPCQKI